MDEEFLIMEPAPQLYYPYLANEEIITKGKLPSDYSVGGWIYVMSNKSMPNIYKIGMTTTTPERRAKELYSSSGVPTPFKVELAYYSHSPREDESRVHRILSEFRVNEAREFFETSLEKIKWACNELDLECRERDLSEIAVMTNVICTDKAEELNIEDIFEQEGIYYFGDKNAIAETMIRMAVRLMLKATGFSFYINDGEISLIERADEQYFRSTENRPQREIPDFIKELINGQSKKY